MISSDLSWFKTALENKEIVERLKNIKLIISDVDGSLTDAKVYVDEEGERGRFFSTQDGYIVKPALEHGIKISLMSGKANKSTEIRAKYIGIPESLCFTGNLNKIELIKKLADEHGLNPDQILIFGDDMPDARVKLASWANVFACPANTPFYIQLAAADLVIPRSGGNDAFRLLLDLILYVQGVHEAQDLIKKSLS